MVIHPVFHVSLGSFQNYLAAPKRHPVYMYRQHMISANICYLLFILSKSITVNFFCIRCVCVRYFWRYANLIAFNGDDFRKGRAGRSHALFFLSLSPLVLQSLVSCLIRVRIEISRKMHLKSVWYLLFVGSRPIANFRISINKTHLFARVFAFSLIDYYDHIAALFLYVNVDVF